MLRGHTSRCGTCEKLSAQTSRFRELLSPLSQLPALKVPPNEITLPASNEIASEEDSHTLKRTQLKLRAVRSASELSELAGGATRYYWKLKVDPTATTSNEMQELLQIIRRLVERDGVFEWIPRLARLQELLEALLARGVGVLAGTYYNHAWTSLEDKDPKTLLMPGERRMKLEDILEIIFVPRDVEEKVICPDLDPGFEEIEKEFRGCSQTMNRKPSCRSFPHDQSQRCGRASSMSETRMLTLTRKRKRPSGEGFGKQVRAQFGTANGPHSRPSLARPERRRKSAVNPRSYDEMGDLQDQMRTQESWEGVPLPPIAKRQADRRSRAGRETHTHSSRSWNFKVEQTQRRCHR